MRLKTPGVWVMGLAFQYRGQLVQGVWGFYWISGLRRMWLRPQPKLPPSPTDCKTPRPKPWPVVFVAAINPTVCIGIDTPVITMSSENLFVVSR